MPPMPKPSAAVTKALQPPTSPFFWSAGGAVTKDELKRSRRISDALRPGADYQPEGVWSLLGGLAGEGVAGWREGEDRKREKAATDAYGQQFAGLADGADESELIALAGNEFANPQQSAVSNALLGRNLDEQSRAEQWAHEDARTAAANAQPAKPIVVNGQLVSPTTGQVVGDYRDPASGPAAPSGYQWAPEGGALMPIPGGPQDPASAAPKPPTDADVRASKLGEVVAPDAALLLGDGTAENPGVYDALSDLGSQVGGADVGGARPGYGLLTSENYQRATNAVGNIAQSYLYAISGQAAPAGEVAKIVDSVTPKPFESKQAIEEKKARLATYVKAIQMSKYDVPGAASATGASAGDGWQVLGVE